jgi:uncharacterized protein YjbI with pentapeptide repeats
MKNINREELNKILKEHELWLEGEGGKCADLSNTDLSNTDLKCANLKNANLRGVNLSNTDLSNINLSNANLKYANLRFTDLSGADLSGADLRCAKLINADLRFTDLSSANLRFTDLSNADLRFTDLRFTDLSGADLSDADLKDIKTNIHTIGYNLACPEKGGFIGYKKASGCLIELLILEDAKRSSATTAKCRCDKAKVLEIRDIKTGKKVNKVNSDYNVNFIYEVGEIIHVDDFDNNRWNECSTGIHFFVNKENAINY